MKNGDKAEPKDVEGEDKEKDEADETQKKEKNGDDFVDILAGVGDGEEVKDRPQMTEQDGEFSDSHYRSSTMRVRS